MRRMGSWQSYEDAVGREESGNEGPRRSIVRNLFGDTSDSQRVVSTPATAAATPVAAAASVVTSATAAAARFVTPSSASPFSATSARRREEDIPGPDEELAMIQIYRDHGKHKYEEVALKGIFRTIRSAQ